MLKKYKMGFDIWALVLFVVIMIPNIIWFAIPAPNDILRTESITKIPDAIASISQVVMLVALCVFINTGREKRNATRFIMAVIINCVLYFICWIFYYIGISNAAVILGMTIFPCLAFLFFAMDRKNNIAIIPIIIFTICHLIYGIVNYIICGLYEKLINKYRVIVIEKFGYGYSDIFEAPCDIDSLVSFQRRALAEAGEKGPFILLPHSMSGLEAIRWKQMYPDDVMAIIGLDMATPKTYKEWSYGEINKRINMMRRIKKIKNMGLLSLYPLNRRGLNRDERKQQRLLWKRNGMNNCFINEAKEVMNNATIVEKSGTIDCPTLLFVSNGKQVSPNWLDNQHEFAKQMKAEMLCFDCGHYIHYFKSDEMRQAITEFTDSLFKKR